MKRCPNCQKRYSDQAQFCIGCGSELEFYDRKPSKGSLIVKGILKTFCYIFLMVGIQNLIATAFLSAVMLGDPVIMAGIMEGKFDNMAVMQQLSEILFSNYTMILLVANLVTILIISLFFTFRKKNPAEEVMLRPVKKLVLPVCALYGIALNIFISVTMSLLPIPVEMLEELDGQYDMLFGQTSLVVEILSTAVLTGLVEEIIFRGLALSRLKRGMSRTAAVVVSAVIFGMFHGAFVAVVYATVLGIVFGFLADRHNSILPTVVCHIFFNATSFFLVTEDAFLLLSLYFLSIVVLFVGSYILFKKDRIEE